MIKDPEEFVDFTESERATVLEYCTRIAPLTESPSPSTLQKITGIANIETEAILFATCHDNQNAALFTGDKNAIKALARRAPGFCANIAGQVSCLEQVLAALVQARGVKEIYAALSSRVGHYGTLKVCFSELNRINQEACLVALGSYVRSLERELPEAWLRSVPPPETRRGRLTVQG